MSKSLDEIGKAEKAAKAELEAAKKKFEAAKKKTEKTLREWPRMFRYKKCGIAFKVSELGYKDWEVRRTEQECQPMGEYETWDKFEEMLRWKCDFDNVQEVINGEDKALRESKYSRKSRRHIRRTVPGGAEFIKRVRKNLGVKTMKEVLHRSDCTLMIHFGDNDVNEINGMTEPGRADEKEYNTEEENEKIRNSKYESESCSVKRFFEILIGYLVEKGKVDLSDPGLLDYWKIDEKDDWYKKKYPGKKYYLDGAVATWQDVYDDMLKCNAIMHEG